MSRGITAVQVWTQVPVANRTVEVNTKTGFSLTAGSYSVRASSTQSGTITVNSVASDTATISSVTATRAFLAGGGNQGANDNFSDSKGRVILTNATTVTANRAGSIGSIIANYHVLEAF